MSMSVCVSVFLFVRKDIFGIICAIFTPNFLCMLPMSVARSSSGMLMIGCIAYQREGADGDGTAQHGRSVIYDCLVMAALCNRAGTLCNGAGHYIFFPVVSFYLLLSSFFSSPNLSGRRFDVYHTLTHGVALVRI